MPVNEAVIPAIAINTAVLGSLARGVITECDFKIFIVVFGLVVSCFLQ